MRNKDKERIEWRRRRRGVEKNTRTHRLSRVGTDTKSTQIDTRQILEKE